MVEIDSITGLPKELGVWEDLTKEAQEIKVFTIKKKFGKTYTVVEGFDSTVDLRDIAKKLKSKFACGGTGKGSKVELQGDHRKKIKESLVNLGFKSETIKVAEGLPRR